MDAMMRSRPVSLGLSSIPVPASPSARQAGCRALGARPRADLPYTELCTHYSSTVTKRLGESVPTPVLRLEPFKLCWLVN
ncbi:hypothetical protein VTN02DRAFT_1139 [Thermoascus thermophilus]